MEGAKIINPDVRIEEFDEQPYLSASLIKA